jgi:hypothetical protein
MRPRKNTAKQRQDDLRETEDKEAIAGGLADHESRYIAWHKANYTEAEHTRFLEEGIIPAPKN